MFQLRTADLKIKSVYDCSKPEQADGLRKIIASSKNLTTEADKKEADRKVIAIEPHYCYVVVSGLHGSTDEDINPNQNGDLFRWDELLKKKEDGSYTFATWIGKPVLENHDSKAVRGEILDVWPIQTEKSIDMLHRVDERLNPNLVKGIRNGSQNGTSMGVMVGHSYCGVCKHLAYDENQWCNHLHPKKLNLKGRRYYGQDGNLYPDKIGQIVYEDNRNLHGVEDSFITLGEPADPHALAKQVFASKDDKMPRENNRAAIEAKRNDLLAGGGITEYTPSTSEAPARTGRVAQSSAGGYVDPSRDPALKAQFAKLLGGIKAAVTESIDYTDSVMVIEAIKVGSLKKTEALTYVEKLNLVTAEELENLTVGAAYKLLEDDAKLLTADIDSQMPSTVVSDESTVNSAKPEKGAPSPDGSANPKNQMPSTMVSTDSTVNKAKPEASFPSPDGKVDQKKLMPTAPGYSDVNKAKPEASFPAPIKLGANDKSTVNNAKPEEGAPNPDGTVSPKSQMPSAVVSTESTVNNSKPEEGTPAPKGEVNPKAQMPAVAALEVKADGMPPMGGPAGGPPAPGGDSDPLAGLDSPMPPDAGGLGKADKAVDGKPSGKHNTLVQEIHDAVGLIADIKEVIDNLDAKLSKKEKKPKGGGEDKKDSPFGGAEKKDDKAPEENKDSPFPPKKEDKAPEKMESEPKVPMVAGYKVDLVEDKTNPSDSYYVASVGGKDLFSVSVKQAWGEKANEKVAEFTSLEYKNFLVASLNQVGAREVFENGFGNNGVVIAQAVPAPSPSPAPAAAPGGPAAGLPNDKFHEPAQNMNVTPEASQKIENDATQKQSFTDVVMSSIAAVISASNNSTASEAVDELRSIFSDEAKSKEFEGRLAEKIENQKPSGGSSPEPTPAGGANDKQLTDVKNALASLKTVMAKAMPEFKKAITERDELKAKLHNIEAAQILKARTIKTLEVAEKKASLGLLDKGDVQQESVRLAQLSDEDLNKELTEFKNSLIIAKNLNKLDKTNDSTNTEGKNKEAVLAAIPNDIKDSSVSQPIKTFQWSVGSGPRKA